MCCYIGGWGGIKSLTQHGNDIQPSNIEEIRAAGMVIDETFEMSTENVPTVRDPDAAIFVVGSGWGHNRLCVIQMTGAGNFSTSMNDIYWTKLNKYPLPPSLTIYYAVTNGLFICPVTPLHEYKAS